MKAITFAWLPWSGALLAGVAVIATALLMPVHLPEMSETSSFSLPEGVVEAAPEDSERLPHHPALGRPARGGAEP